MLENLTAAAKVKIPPAPGLDLRRYAVRSRSALRKTNVPRTAWRTLLLTGLAAAPAGVAAQARIPEVRVRGKSPCEVHPETAAETAELWLSAEAALKSSTAADSNPPLLMIQKWRRTLSRSFKLFYEQRDTSLVATRQPFGTPTPSNLERAGYIQQMFHTVIFYGPDPDEIITERFLRQHCFRRVEGSGATQGLVGLAFDPLPRQQKPDVSGILWIDPVSERCGTSNTAGPILPTGPTAERPTAEPTSSAWLMAGG